MGPKAGLNGLDNGFATFNNVRIPRENLLNRTGDVTPDGKYVTPFKDPSKRFGVSLGALSNGRVGLTHYACCFQNIALTVAIRYAAVRRQFGANGNGKTKEELPILEYQLMVFKTCFFKAFFYSLIISFAFKISINILNNKLFSLKNSNTD